MIKVLIGDLFESNNKTLVNTVNTVGVMGKGIAREFKKRYPAMFEDYEQRCKMKQLEVGVPYYYEDMLGASIVNFPAKGHWRSPAKLQDIINGLDIFVEKHREWGIESIAFPPLGCGNGGLEWSLVGKVMYQKLANLDIPVEIYASYGAPREQLTTDFLKQSYQADDSIQGSQNGKFNPAWIAILAVMDLLAKQPYVKPVGRTIFQKICYIMTVQGIDTQFNFRRGNYGPFSDEVKDALSLLFNENLLSEKQSGRMNVLIIGSEYENTLKKYQHELKPLKKKIHKTADLFSRIKNTGQAEEVTTVIYAVRQLKESKQEVSEQELFDYIMNWKKKWRDEDKKASVGAAIRNLEMLGWLHLQYSESLPVPAD